MSVVQNTLIGRSRGSIGGVTFSTWKGLNVAKGKPVSVANPNTESQQLQRSQLRKGVAFFRLASAILNIGFRQQAINKSAYNAYMSTNLKNGALNEGQASPPYVVPEMLVIAKGSLYPNNTFDADASVATDEITIGWPGDYIADQQENDKANILVVDADGIIVAQSVGTATRGTGIIAIPSERPLVLAEELTAYLFFSQVTTGKVSDSKAALIVVAA